MHRLLLGALFTLAACAVAHADDRATLRFDAQEALSDAVTQPPDDAQLEAALDGVTAPALFGDQSDDIWFSYGLAAGAVIGRDDSFVQPYIAFSGFIADTFEVGAEIGGWYLQQDVGDDTLGGSASLVFRWHFFESNQERDWTIFASAAIGMLFTSEELAGDGNRYNFLPTGGLGFTHRLGDGPNRLIGGVRWQHISNGRLGGGDENPGRDYATLYLGLMMPF